ncbi:hypothetical protein EVAR_6003_1 [Eumeta japonica]|uniref:Uncharacterized protein n=1 Tax=Eumeta variegata TaxID=151549 RepID=A0A4C1TAL5_EUMVA|nr:hypothetical protein EVAR_6003_1 [Eumeta japonica]
MEGMRSYRKRPRSEVGVGIFWYSRSLPGINGVAFVHSSVKALDSTTGKRQSERYRALQRCPRTQGRDDSSLVSSLRSGTLRSDMTAKMPSHKKMVSKVRQIVQWILVAHVAFRHAPGSYFNSEHNLVTSSESKVFLSFLASQSSVRSEVTRNKIFHQIHSYAYSGMYNARNSAAVKLVTIASQWRGHRNAREEGGSGSAEPAHAITGSSERQFRALYCRRKPTVSKLRIIGLFRTERSTASHNKDQKLHSGLVPKAARAHVTHPHKIRRRRKRSRWFCRGSRSAGRVSYFRGRSRRRDAYKYISRGG